MLIVDSSDRGGIARYTDHLASELRVLGLSVHLAAGGARAPRPLRLRSLRWGVRPATRGQTIVFYVRRALEIPLAAWSLVRAWRAADPDVVHIHTAVARRADPLIYRVLRRRGPVVVTVHNAVPHERAGREGPIERRRWAAADLLMVHDDAAADLVRSGLPRAVVRVVSVDLIGRPTGIERRQARRHLGIQDGPVALMLGLLRPYKGFDLMVDVWPLVRAAVADATLAIAGDLPEDFDAFRRLERLPGVRTRIGWLSDVETDWWAAAADVCLLPYRHGAHSGVLHRAAANRTPTIASPCLGAEVARFRSGPVVPLEVDSWALAISAALTTPLPPPEAPVAGSFGRQTVAAYDEALARWHVPA